MRTRSRGSRRDESVAAQERAEGGEDKEDAKARVDEAIGEDAVAKAAEAKSDAVDALAYDPRPDIAALREEIKGLKELLVKSRQEPEAVQDDATKTALEKAAAIYLN